MHHHFRNWMCRSDHAFGSRVDGRHGFGRFAGGFADDGETGGRGFRSGRKISGADLQLVILALIAEKPRHGYEIIKELEERSNGFYTPSPGVVYPALTYLEEIGHASVSADALRKLYTPTQTGLDFLATNKTAVEAILSQIERIGAKMDRMRRAFSGEDTRSPEMIIARRDLRTALDDKRDASPQELLRIAEILTRATQEIRGN